MEQNGLISRERSSLDARLKKIVAAEKARSYAPILSRDLSKLEFALTAGIAPEDLAIWKKVTAQMLQNLESFSVLHLYSIIRARYHSCIAENHVKQRTI